MYLSTPTKPNFLNKFHIEWLGVSSLNCVNVRDELMSASRAKSFQQTSAVSSSEDEASQVNKVILECEGALEQTQSLQIANSQLLKPEDYVRLRLYSFLDNNEAMVKNARCSNTQVINCKHNKSLDIGKRSIQSKDELIGSKGFCSYVFFVTSYVIFLVIITYLLNQIGNL